MRFFNVLSSAAAVEALSAAPPVAAPEMISGPTLDDPHGHGEAADWCRSLSAMFPPFHVSRGSMRTNEDKSWACKTG
jgi:hypothetical protein